MPGLCSIIVIRIGYTQYIYSLCEVKSEGFIITIWEIGVTETGVVGRCISQKEIKADGRIPLDDYY